MWKNFVILILNENVSFHTLGSLPTSGEKCNCNVTVSDTPLNL
jgi:hypothetical protein